MAVGASRASASRDRTRPSGRFRSARDPPTRRAPAPSGARAVLGHSRGRGRGGGGAERGRTGGEAAGVGTPWGRRTGHRAGRCHCQAARSTAHSRVNRIGRGPYHGRVCRRAAARGAPRVRAAAAGCVSCRGEGHWGGGGGRDNGCLGPPHPESAPARLPPGGAVRLEGRPRRWAGRGGSVYGIRGVVVPGAAAGDSGSPHVR